MIDFLDLISSPGYADDCDAVVAQYYYDNEDDAGNGAVGFVVLTDARLWW